MTRRLQRLGESLRLESVIETTEYVTGDSVTALDVWFADGATESDLPLGEGFSYRSAPTDADIRIVDDDAPHIGVVRHH